MAQPATDALSSRFRKESTYSARAIKTETSACPLNSLDLPPVGHAEHMGNQCHCHLCVCGEHKCPADFRRVHQSTSTQFRTNYRQEFRKFPHEPVAVYRREGCFYPSTFGLETKSTQKADYQAYSVLPVKHLTRSQTFTSFPGVAARSSYQCQFVNWGPLNTKLVTQRKYVRNDVQLKGSSTYQHDFKELKVEPFTPVKVSKTQSRVLTGSEWFGTVKTRRKTPIAFPKREKAIETGYVPAVSCAKQYSTSYRDSFQGASIQLLPKKKYAGK